MKEVREVINRAGRLQRTILFIDEIHRFNKSQQDALLGAVEKGYGGCIIGAVDRLPLQRELKMSSELKILQVIALGVPKEEVVIEEMGDDHKYWRDMKGIHHVPKRNLKDIIVDL